MHFPKIYIFGTPIESAGPVMVSSSSVKSPRSARVGLIKLIGLSVNVKTSRNYVGIVLLAFRNFPSANKGIQSYEVFQKVSDHSSVKVYCHPATHCNT